MSGQGKAANPAKAPGSRKRRRSWPQESGERRPEPTIALQWQPGPSWHPEEEGSAQRVAPVSAAGPLLWRCTLTIAGVGLACAEQSRCKGLDCRPCMVEAAPQSCAFSSPSKLCSNPCWFETVFLWYWQCIAFSTACLQIGQQFVMQMIHTLLAQFS